MFLYSLTIRALGLAKRRVARLIVAAWLLMTAVSCGTASEDALDPRAADNPLPGQSKPNLSPKYSAIIANETLRITGTGASTELALRLQAGVPTVLEIDIEDDGSADFSFDRALFDSILVNAGGGDDLIRIDQANGAFTDTELTTINGGGGEDTLLGGSGAETFDGGPGNDIIDGNQGADSAFMGPGDDTFIWDPGDGSDLVEGDAGADLMVFNGSAGGEDFDLSAIGPRLRFFRAQGNIVMDVDGVEQVDVNALGGPDDTAVNDLTGTAVTQVNVDLTFALGGNTGDLLADSITVNGTEAADTINIAGDAGAVEISGLAASIRVTHSELATDSLIVNGLDGVDTITPDAGVAVLILLTINQD